MKLEEKTSYLRLNLNVKNGKKIPKHENRSKSCSKNQNNVEIEFQWHKYTCRRDERNILQSIDLIKRNYSSILCSFMCKFLRFSHIWIWISIPNLFCVHKDSEQNISDEFHRISVLRSISDGNNRSSPIKYPTIRLVNSN